MRIGIAPPAAQQTCGVLVVVGKALSSTETNMYAAIWRAGVKCGGARGTRIF
jgi:hypothetical protein